MTATTFFHPLCVQDSERFIKTRSHTNEPIYLLSEGFHFGNKLRASPSAAQNVSTRNYEIKFSGQASGVLAEIDVLVRPRDIVKTFIPVDPSHTDAEIEDAIRDQSVGTLRLKCGRISRRSHALIPLRVRV
jgi:hypothetical protein